MHLIHRYPFFDIETSVSKNFKRETLVRQKPVSFNTEL